MSFGRIGIFGGTFDPVHNGHISVAEAAIRELSLDKLIVVPSYMPPHKTLPSTAPKDRINMLSVAFSGEDKIEVSDFEIKNGENGGGKSYTFITVERFAEIYKDAELFFIVGLDMLKDFKTWKNPERILDKATIAAFGRGGEDFDEKKEREYFRAVFGKDFIKLDFSGGEYSSTEIRVRKSLDLPIDGLTADGVADYIEKNNVYPKYKYADFLKSNLKNKRLEHTANVILAGISKAKSLRLAEDKVFEACALHDCAKYLSEEDYKGFNPPKGIPAPVVHAFLGAYVAENTLGVKDEEVLDAIRYHTSGKANMSTLSKLVFVADMVEKGRDYQGVEILRQAFKGDFDKCFILCLTEEYIHLLNKKVPIFYLTEEAVNYYAGDINNLPKSLL